MAINKVEYPLLSNVSTMSNVTRSSPQPLTSTSPSKLTFEDHPEHLEMSILVHTN